MNRTCEQRQSFRKMETQKNTYTEHQKGTVEISRLHNEERGLREFDTHRTY